MEDQMPLRIGEMDSERLDVQLATTRWHANGKILRILEFWLRETPLGAPDAEMAACGSATRGVIMCARCCRRQLRIGSWHSEKWF